MKKNFSEEQILRILQERDKAPTISEIIFYIIIFLLYIASLWDNYFLCLEKALK